MMSQKEVIATLFSEQSERSLRPKLRRHYNFFVTILYRLGSLLLLHVSIEKAEMFFHNVSSLANIAPLLFFAFLSHFFFFRYFLYTQSNDSPENVIYCYLMFLSTLIDSVKLK